MRGILCVFLLTTIGAVAAPVPAEKAVGELEVYPGLEATLFASEPMIGSPTNIDIDRKGRVWVCDVQNYRAHARKPVRPKGDRIVILEDTDWDGVADKRTLYYEGRDVDAALGICVLGPHVIVSSAPNIIVFTDEDGDDQPDRKEYLFTKTGRPQNDHSTHSVVFGPDGCLYWNFGNAGQRVHDDRGRVVKDWLGNPIIDESVRKRPSGEWSVPEDHYWGGMAFRCKIAGFGRKLHVRDHEVIGHNFRNNYELAVDSLGTVWQTDNDDDGHYAARINYVMEGGNFGYRDQRTGASWKTRRVGQHEEVASRHWHQNDPGVVPNFLVTGAGSPTGITVYEGRLLPKVFWDAPLACDAGPGVVWGTQARPKGAGFEGALVNLVSGGNDRWFRPVDVAVAPDGSAFVSDWYDPHVGWNRQGDLTHGRIYRIAPKGHRYQLTERAKTFADGLKNPNRDYRFGFEQAANLVPERARESCRKLFAESDNVVYRSRALWLLWRMGDQETLRAALTDSDEDVRMVALRAAARGSAQTPIGERGWNHELLAAMAEDSSPRVRRECALALRFCMGKEAGKIWAKLARQHDGKDRWYLEAIGIGGRFVGRLPYLFTPREFIDPKDSFTPVEEQLIWRSLKDHYWLRKILLSHRDSPHPDWRKLMRAFDDAEPAHGYYSSMEEIAFGDLGRGDPAFAELKIEALLRLKEGYFRDEGWQAEVEERYPGAKAAVDELAKWTGKEVEARLELLEKVNAQGVGPDILKWVAAHPKHPSVTRALRMAVKDIRVFRLRWALDALSEAERLAVMKLLGRLRDRPLALILKGYVIDEELDSHLRGAAVLALSRTDHGMRQLINLAEDGDFPEELKTLAGTAIKNTYDVGLHDRAAKLFPIPETKGDGKLPQMTDLVVYVGKAERGKKVFGKATCANCHVVNGEGTSFGPDLSYIGAKLSKQGLYEAILNPDAGISPSYQLHELTLKSGETRVGLLENDGEVEVALRLPGGDVERLAVDEIAKRKTLPTSAMPATLASLMSVDELIDLVEYLSSLRQQRQK